jgi:DNA replicative helicase MCM subunit Mcm2 (Cdc46/Mcm family)
MGILDGTEFDDVVRLQKQLASSMLDDFELDSKIKILTIIDEIAGPGRKKIHTEKLLIEAENRGMSEFEVTSIIEKLKRDGLVIEPQPGYLQKY